MSEKLVKPQPVHPASITTASGTKIPLANNKYQGGFKAKTSKVALQKALEALPPDMLIENEQTTDSDN